MATHRYWRLVGFDTYEGGTLELSEARLYAGGTIVDGSGTLTCTAAPTSGALSDLRDGSTASVVSWSPSKYKTSGFAIVFDLTGSGASVDGIKLGSGSSVRTFPYTLTLQFSDNGTAWTLHDHIVSAAYPGAFSLTAPDPAGDLYFTANSALLHFKGTDGSTSIVDVMGKTWTSFNSAALSTAWSAFGASSLRLGGSKYISTPSHSDFDLGSGDFTISLTVRIVTVDSGTYMAFFSRDLIGGTRGWISTTEPGTGLAFGVNVGATNYVVLDPVVFSPGETINYVFGRDNGYLRMYKNGVQVSATAISGSINSSGTPLVIGGLWNTSGAMSGVSPNVYIDEFRICKVAIYPNGTTFTPPTSPWLDVKPRIMAIDPDARTLAVESPASTDADFEKVSLLLHCDGAHGSTVFADSSLDENLVINLGGAKVSTTSPKVGSGCLALDGSSALSIPSSAAFNFDGDYTLEMHARLGSVSGDHHLLSKYSTSTTCAFAIFQSADTLEFYSSSNGTTWNLVANLTFGTGLVTGVWYHLAITRSGNVYRTFRNGVQIATATVSGTPIFTDQPVYIGRGNNTAPSYFVGDLDDVRLTKGVARYTSNFMPPTLAFSDDQFLPVDIGRPARLRSAPLSLEHFVGSDRPDGAAISHLREVSFFDAYYGGLATVRGSVKEKNLPVNTPLHRRVLLLDQRSQQVIRETWSDDDGSYMFYGIRDDIRYTIICYDYTGTYRAVIIDNVIPELI